MGRIIAIDYGLKRCGVAVTDDAQVFAFGHDTIATHQIFDFIENYQKTADVSGLLVGMPMRLHNQPSEMTAHVETFVNECKSRFPKWNHYIYDERFTSKIAAQSIASSGHTRKAKSNKGLVDKVSATLILQSFLAAQKNTL